MDEDNEKLLRPTGEQASLKNVSLIPLASTGLKISADQLAAWTATSGLGEARMRVREDSSQ